MRLFLMLLGITLMCTSGYSATWYVPGDYPKIQDAISSASVVDGDTIIVRPGTYVENINFLGKAITLQSEQGAEVTVIDGNKNGSVVKFKNSEGPDSVLDGFTVRNGTGSPVYIFNYCGGGILCQLTASPTIKNNIITQNQADYGAGIYGADGASPTIVNNTIINNAAAQEGGGLLFQHGASPTISYNTITENTAEKWGGGIEFYHNCLLTVTNNVFKGNVAVTQGGGGIVMANNCSGTITNNIIIGNSANYYGGIYCEDNTSPLMIGNIVASNTAVIGNTGGMYCRDNCQPVCVDCVFAYNTAGYNGVGGGFMVHTSCDVTLTNCLFIGNTAGNGGGVRIGATSNAVITNCSFHGNHADCEPGGAFAAGSGTPGLTTITMSNCILWGNTAPSGYEISLHGSYPAELTISYSDVAGGQAGAYVHPGSVLNWGPGMIDADPLYASGPCGFSYLCQVAAGQPSNSPCVDTGSDLASNLGMDLYWTRTDDVHDSGTVDMGFHYGADFLFPSLQADIFDIPEDTGGTANYLLLAGPDNANRNYLILGSISGTNIGIPLPGGKVTLPLTYDFFTTMTILYANTPVFLDFMGTLDAMGTGTAQMNLGPATGAAGITMYFAYALNKPWNFVSNPVSVDIVP